MTSQKKFIFWLLLCLLLIGKVQPQFEDCEEELFYTLPNPMVNTTLTVFSQNPSFINDVTSLSNQIASAIVAASSASNPFSSIMGPFGSILGCFGLGSSGQSITELTNLFVTFSELIGQEAQMSEVQGDITTYLSNLNSWNSDLTLVASLTNASDIYSQLTPILVDLNEAYGSFQNQVFSQYAYYTMQPLFLNAVIHVNVLSMLSLTNAILGRSQDSETYQANAISIYNSYVTLLEIYSAYATAYRLSFITQLEICPEEFGGCPPEDPFTVYYFQDNFLSGDPIVWHGEEIGCPGFLPNGALNSYTQAVSSGTSDFFNSLVTSYQTFNPASSVPLMQDPESSSFFRVFGWIIN